jgi:uncharacterized protein YecT (DUF1311 family)
LPLWAPALLLTVAASRPAPAQQSVCGDAITQFDINRCVGQHLDASQRMLTRLLQSLDSSLTRDRAAQLTRVQRAWISYRDQQCEWDGRQFEGGSMQAMEVAGCRWRLTEARIVQLRPWVCDGQRADCPAARRFAVSRDSLRTP